MRQNIFLRIGAISLTLTALHGMSAAPFFPPLQDASENNSIEWQIALYPQCTSSMHSEAYRLARITSQSDDVIESIIKTSVNEEQREIAKETVTKLLGHSTVALGCGGLVLYTMPDLYPLLQDPLNNQVAITSLAMVFFALGAWNLHRVKTAYYELNSSREKHNNSTHIVHWNGKWKRNRSACPRNRASNAIPRYSFLSWIRLGLLGF